MSATQMSPDKDECAAAVLVVEDEVLIRAAVCDHLRDSGYTVLEAASADEAIAILRNGVLVKLVFSDVRLPGTMDGIALSEWVHENRPGIAVLLTSGDPQKICAAEELSRDGPFLPKPYDLAEVNGRIATALAAPRLRAV